MAHILDVQLQRVDAVKTILSLHSERQGVPENITPSSGLVTLSLILALMGRQNNSGGFLVIQRLQITDNAHTNRLCHKSKYTLTVLLKGLTYCFQTTNLFGFSWVVIFRINKYWRDEVINLNIHAIPPLSRWRDIFYSWRGFIRKYRNAEQRRKSVLFLSFL